MALSSDPTSILNSWKEISSYLERGCRTVQRWEKNLGLPVHRLGTGPRAPVIAFKNEIDAWFKTSASPSLEQLVPGEPRDTLITQLNAEKIRALCVTITRFQDQIARARAICSGQRLPWNAQLREGPEIAGNKQPALAALPKC